MKPLRNKKGVAILTVLLFLIIVTLLATGAIMLATVQVKVAGSVAQAEGVRAAAEGAINYAIPLIQSIHFNHTIPVAYQSTVISSPAPASPNDTIPRLVYELTDPSESSNYDLVDGASPNPGPNVTLTPAAARPWQGGYTVNVDIDALGAALMAGGSIEESWAYHKGAESPVVSGYKITARATTPSGKFNSKMCQVIWQRSVL